MEHYDFPEDLAKFVWENLEKEERDWFSENDLCNVCNIAYQASLKTEELRRPRFQLAFFPEGSTNCAEINVSGTGAFFYTSRQLNHGELVKLALAVNERETYILVDPSSDKNSIWGMLNIGYSWEKYVSNLEPCHTSGPPQTVIIRCESPGAIDCFFGDEIIGVLRDGKVTLPRQWGIRPEVSKHFNKAQKKLREQVFKSGENNPSESDRSYIEYGYSTYSNVLAKLVHDVSVARHGGTILVVSDEKDIDNLVQLKYDLRKSHFGLSEHILKWLRYELDLQMIHREHRNSDHQSKIYLRDKEVTKLVDKMGFVSQCCNVDGATLLSSELNLIGFGGELTPNKNENLMVIDQDTKNAIDWEQRGMRHRSAFKACASKLGIIALIVSQDGGVTAAVRKQGGKVEIWRNAASFFLGLRSRSVPLTKTDPPRLG